MYIVEVGFVIQSLLSKYTDRLGVAIYVAGRRAGTFYLVNDINIYPIDKGFNLTVLGLLI